MCVRTHRVILRCFRYRMFPEPAGGYVVATRWCIFTRAIPEITESRWKEEDGKGFVYFPLFSLFLFFFFHFSPVHFLIQPFRPQVERFAVHTITPPPLASCTKIFIVPDQVTHGYRTTWKVNEPRVYKDFAVSFFFFLLLPPPRWNCLSCEQIYAEQIEKSCFITVMIWNSPGRWSGIGNHLISPRIKLEMVEKFISNLKIAIR